jgi:hypothetical protein
LVLFGALALVAAACGDTVEEPDPLGPEAWTEPPQEPGDIELIGHFTTATHAGDRGVSTHPDADAPAPSFCIAYRDGTARDRDSCVVGTEPFEWEDGIHPWTVEATWSQLHEWDDALVERLAVHAFDEHGRPVAHWDGRMHEHAGHLTE